jgi:hypothetical protein
MPGRDRYLDGLLVLVAAWMVLAIIFVIYVYFARLKYPVSESVFGRVVVISFLIITTSIWLPIIVGALALSLIGHLWSRFRTNHASTVLTDTDPAAPQVVLIGEGDNVPQALLDAANNVVALSVRTPPRTIESRCMSPEVAPTGPTGRSDDVRCSVEPMVMQIRLNGGRRFSADTP